MISFVITELSIYLFLKGNLHYANYLENNGYKPFLIINADNIKYTKSIYTDYKLGIILFNKLK